MNDDISNNNDDIFGENENYGMAIVSSQFQRNNEGHYKFGYESSDGTRREEEGIGGVAVRGSYSYRAPDGQEVQVAYIADENGFRTIGNVIDESIQKSLHEQNEIAKTQRQQNERTPKQLLPKENFDKPFRPTPLPAFEDNYAVTTFRPSQNFNEFKENFPVLQNQPFPVNNPISWNQDVNQFQKQQIEQNEQLEPIPGWTNLYAKSAIQSTQPPVQEVNWFQETYIEPQQINEVFSPPPQLQQQPQPQSLPQQQPLTQHQQQNFNIHHDPSSVSWNHVNQLPLPPSIPSLKVSNTKVLANRWKPREFKKSQVKHLGSDSIQVNKFKKRWTPNKHLVKSKVHSNMKPFIIKVTQ